jgi:hypothetical protein
MKNIQNFKYGKDSLGLYLVMYVSYFGFLLNVMNFLYANKEYGMKG